MGLEWRLDPDTSGPVRRGYFALVFTVLAASTPTVAAPAQEAEDEASSATSADDSEAVYREGRQALIEKKPARARAAFARGLEATRGGEGRFRFLLGIALAHEMAGAPARASWFYRAFLEAAETDLAGEDAPWRQRRERVARDLQALLDEARAGTGELTIRSTPPGAEVAVDGEWLPPELATPVTLRMSPGEHRIDLRGAQGRVVSGSSLVRAGAPVVFERAVDPPPPPVEPAEKPSGTDPPAPEPSSDVAPPPAPPPEVDVEPLRGTSRASPLPWWIVGGSAAGLGVAAVATGGVLTALAQTDLDELEELSASPSSDENIRRDAEVRTRFARREGAGVALFASGALLTGIGVTTLVLAATTLPPEDDQPQAFVTLGGLGVRGRF